MRKVARALFKAYAEKDANTKFMQGPPGDDHTKSWIQEVVLLTASAAVEAQQKLSEEDLAIKWGHLIINRIIRGVLWTICNGNAPGWDPLAEDDYRGHDRRLECSLSSRWLEEGETVYIS